MENTKKIFAFVTDLEHAIYTDSKLARDRVIYTMTNEEDERLSETMFGIFETAISEIEHEKFRFMLDGFMK